VRGKEGGLMSADVPRTGRFRTEHNQVATGNTSKNDKTTVTREQSKELRQLYEELANASMAAREALKVANEKSTGIAFEKFRKLDARVEAILTRINAILG
jgi:hypothetical protein